MKLGAALPHSGADASPDGMVAFAHRAEELGLDSLRVLERILRPVAPAGNRCSRRTPRRCTRHWRRWRLSPGKPT
jgi:hypothetical protein